MSKIIPGSSDEAYDEPVLKRVRLSGKTPLFSSANAWLSPSTVTMFGAPTVFKLNTETVEFPSMLKRDSWQVLVSLYSEQSMSVGSAKVAQVHSEI